MTSAPSLVELISKITDNKFHALHVALIGEVKSYNADIQCADIKLIARKNKNLPILPNTPVLFPRCRDFHMVYPLKAGDIVQVLFNDTPIDAWLHGESKSHFEGEHHSLHGAVAIPGIYPDSKAIKNLELNALTLGHKDNQIITVKVLI